MGEDVGVRLGTVLGWKVGRVGDIVGGAEGRPVGDVEGSLWLWLCLWFRFRSDQKRETWKAYLEGPKVG